MKFLQRIIQKELVYYHRLTADGKHLLTSYLLYNLTCPLLGTFLNVFLWRQAHDMNLVALYNMGSCIMLPFGFYLNGLLLQKFSVTKVYFVGCVLESLMVSVVVFLPSVSYMTITLYGFFYGLGLAFYWANKNLLSVRSTDQSHRIYYSSLESFFTTFINIVVPIFTGWFIVLGEKLHLYSINQAYGLLGFLAFVILIIAGLSIQKSTIKKVPVPHILVKESPPIWSWFRLYTFITGIAGGIGFFLMTLYIVTFLGNEDIVGTISSVSAVLSAVIIYYVGKYSSLKHRFALVAINVLLSLVAILIFDMWFITAGLFVYIFLNTLAGPFGWVSYGSLSMDSVEDAAQDESYQYSFIFDDELFLNGGRVIGMLGFIGCNMFFGSHLALRFVPLFAAAIQLLLLVILKKMIKLSRLAI